MKTKILLLPITFSLVSELSAQTTDVGTFKNKAGNGTAIIAYTDSALGVGTALPEGKAEIRYCPPPLSEHSGLLVTRVFCHGPLGASLGGVGGTLGGGLSDGTTGEGQSLPNSGVVQVPHCFTPFTPLRFPIHSINNNTAPLLWLKTQDPSMGTGLGGNDHSRLLVLPDGRTGINVANPRAALDVRGFGQNTPAAIFGVRAQRSSFTIAGNPLSQQYTKHVEVVPDCSQGAYNNITQNSDLGLFFTDGLGNEGSNQNGALVIGPWNNKIGGLRIDNFGNISIGCDNTFGYKFAVNGSAIIKDEILITNKKVTWPDYIFHEYVQNNCQLNDTSSINYMDLFIKKYKHLPFIPSAYNINENGIKTSELLSQLTKQIEVLSLQIIDLHHLLKKQQIEIDKLANNK